MITNTLIKKHGNTRILLTGLVLILGLARQSVAQAQELESNAASEPSCYGALLSGVGQTLSANVQSLSSNGTVVVNGVDLQGPSTPFQFAWGDGSTTSGFFPQTHVYASTTKNYIITITATENNGTKQTFTFVVFFVAPTVTPKSFPGVSVKIPSSPISFASHWPAYAPPSDVTEFPDSAFSIYSRSDVADILTGIASIDYGFANKNSFLDNGEFSIIVLQNTSFGGGYSFWYTTPMSVGYGRQIFNSPVGWSTLFNEIGKDTTLNSPTKFTYGGNTDGSASEIYSETMGDIFGYSSGCQLVSSPSSYGLDPFATADIRSSLITGAANLQEMYNNYVSSGAPFSSWNPYNGGPDPTGGTTATLAWKFIEHAEQQKQGYLTPARRLMWLLQGFNSYLLARYAPSENTEAAATFRSTLMVTALSYAFTEDLRTEFRGLNFPIDNDTFEQLYEMATGGGATLSPATESFGSVSLGETSSGKTITLTNHLLTPIAISEWFTGNDPKDFRVESSSTCPHPGGTLAANASCTYVVVFHPSVPAAESATFRVSEVAKDVSLALANSPQSVKLSGTGTK